MRALILLMLLAATECPSQQGSSSETRGSTRPSAPQILDGEESDLMLPGFEPLGPDGSPAFSVTPVLDEETGRPIVGAEARVVREPCCAIGDRWTTVRSAKSDEHGWLRLPVTGERGWVFVLAEGYAPQAQLATVLDNRPFLMRRGLDVPVEVRDWWDRPIPGVAIEQLIGCGHTPNVRRVVTDRNGLAVVPRVDPLLDGDLWPVKEGYASRYGSILGWKPEMPPVRIRMGPAPTIEGVVVDATGKLMRDVFVGSPQCHRGPWARTDQIGRFRLIGSTSRYLEVRDEFGKEPLGSLEFRNPPAAGIVIRLGENGTATLEGSRPESSRAVASPLRLKFRPQDLPDDARILVLSEETEDDVSDVALAGGSYIFTGSESAPVSLDPREAVPTGGSYMVANVRPLAVKIIVGADEKVIPLAFPSVQSDNDVPLTWHDPRLVRVRLIGPDGQSVAGRVHLRSARTAPPDTPDAPGSVAIGANAPVDVTCRLVGHVFVYAWPDDRSLNSTRFGLDLAPGQLTADVRLESAAATRVTVLGTDGSPAFGIWITAMWHDVVRESSTDDDGSVRISWFPNRTGTTILARPEEQCMPCRWTLEGPGPWTLRFPTASLDVEARQADGSAVSGFGVIVDSYPFDSADGRAVIRGLAPGQHEVWVAARGFRPKRVSLSVAPRQERRVAIVLRPKD